MNAKSYIYSLKPDKNGDPILSYDFGLRITQEDTSNLHFDTGKEIVVLNKYEYMNKFKVYEFGKGLNYFIVCNKQVSASFAYKKLLEYALNKIRTQLMLLQGFEAQYKKLLPAA